MMEDENDGNYGCDNDKQEPDKLEEVDWRKRQFPRANMVYPPIKTVFEQEMTKKCEEVYMCLALLKANKRSLCAQLQADTEQVVVVVVVVGIIYIN